MLLNRYQQKIGDFYTKRNILDNRTICD